jgi:pimeloyl-ACP methyl ester carboxylesterase
MDAPGLSRVGDDRFDVRSADGTVVAVWVDGEGPPLVLVHGGMNDHWHGAGAALRRSPAVAGAERGQGCAGSCRVTTASVAAK